MKKRLLITVILLLLLIQSMPFGITKKAAASENMVSKETVNVVVIHAYHLGYQWTYNQNEGLRKELLAAYPEANLFTEFLDWKRFPDEAVILDKAQEFRDKYKDVDVDLLLVTDDMGLQFAIKYREELFDNAPIVFGGIIDTTADEIIGDEKNITGVYEKMQPEGAILLQRTLQPEVDELIMIHDLSESGIRTNTTFLNAIDSLGLTKEYTITDWSDKSYADIVNDLGCISKNTAVIFISYSISSDGIVKPPQTFCKEFSDASSVPMYSIDEHQFGYGILGGTFLSGLLHGEEIGRLGVRVLNGECADTIPCVDEATVYSGVDETYMKKYGLDKSLLSSDCIILNEEVSFYEQNKILVNSTLAVLLFLLVLVVVLLAFQRKLRKSRTQIMESKNQLQSLNDELRIGEEELIAQNEELEEMRANLEYENKHDYLTGLHNRKALEKYLDENLIKIEQYGKAAIIFIDLDNFKFINNTYGHHFGDELLCKVGKRLEIMEEELYVSRIGGDEFVLVKIYHSVEDALSLKSLLVRVSKAITDEFLIEEKIISITASIGYSVYPDNGSTFEQLLMEADVAMYSAKKDGKSALKKYVKGMNDIFQNEFLLIRKVKEGLEKDEFYVQYQPIVSIDGSKVISFEALVRWQDEELGPVSPMRFIPVAESSGLILPIGALVCKKVMEFYDMLLARGLTAIKLSLNVSIVQFYQEHFVDDLVNATKTCGIDPKYMQIEITESIMIEAYDYIIEKLTRLKECGFQIALDDFGTGFSSLAYLQKLPIDVIKIDKTFVDQITDYRGSTLVDATISLAKRFNLATIAEGVETKEQFDYLQRAGCDMIQGFYFSKPLLSEDAIDFAVTKNLSNS